MIYRKNTSNNHQFYLVQNSVAQLRLRWSNINNNNFQCQDKMLNEKEQFKILQNDIVVACFWSEFLTSYPIPLVSMSDNSRWTYHNSNNEACSNGMEQLDTQAEYFEHQSLVLHVNANIRELY